MSDLANISALAARVVAAAVEWLEGWKVQQSTVPGGASDRITPGSLLRPLQDAVEAFQAACAPVPLTWGQVPAGWEVLAPNGQWYAVEATRRTGHGTQAVMMLGKTWSRDPAGPVTARPGAVDATDVAIAALGYPDVLEDGR